MIHAYRRGSAPGSGLVLALVLASGCLSGAPPQVYEPTEGRYIEIQQPIPDSQPQIEVGRSILPLDALNHFILSLPAKLLLLNVHLQDHRLPDPAHQVLERYLAVNNMTSVKIRHNEYAPIGEFLRLWRNREVGIGYRATLGLVSWLQYTLIPDRVFGGTLILPGGDHYNPFSNTVNVYSSDLAVLLHEAGHAKDFQRHVYKGGWALLRVLPGLPLWQEANASIDAVRFFGCIDDTAGELAAYPTLLPAYATYVANGSALLLLPLVVTGHVAGYNKARARQERISSTSSDAQEERLRWRRFQPEGCEATPAATPSDTLPAPEGLPPETDSPPESPGLLP